MTLLTILIFALGALVVRAIPVRWRGWALLMGSLMAIYWLQPERAPLRPLGFILPTLVLAAAFLAWLLTRPDLSAPLSRDDALTGMILGGWVILMAAVGEGLRLAAPAPPILQVILGLGGVGLLAMCLVRGAVAVNRNVLLWLFIGGIVAVFVVLKSDPLATLLAASLRAAGERPLTLAGVGDLGWIGFLYVAFRLIHTLRDRQMGKLPALSLREYLTYLIFFPAYTAGPIDRAERFAKDYRALPPLDAPRFIEGVGRIVVGLLKKFVIADSLAVIALNATLAEQAQRPLHLWLIVYAYAFRLFFDFSGYSDIAIGIARLYGVALPENFTQPYLKSNITQFWQSWHATLSTWARFYVFMPVSRFMLTRKRKPAPEVVVLTAHLTTMIVIGLWHGITVNFFLWGVWHGVALFIHKLYSDRTRGFYQRLADRPLRRRLVYAAGVLLTFHVVALGWVWFALPQAAHSLQTLGRLVGIGW
ncbi:MAG TPA: MBOAT family O-acyltransferase [Aggregatilineales bacterium]|nr:MBOAT family O-acyltransferase [Aggregatilineales bacterium]